MLLIIIWYFFHNYFWPQPWPHSPGLGLVAVASASKLWPRPQGFGLVQHHCILPGSVWSHAHRSWSLLWITYELHKRSSIQTL